MKPLMAYLYHFLIMFEVLFILTLLETGARVARFIVEEAVRQFRPDASGVHKTSWSMNIATSAAVCFCWGYLLYTGNIDRLWRMMGIANQLLAVIGLAVGTTYLLLHAPKRAYALCTAIPFGLVVVSVFTAGVLGIGMWWQEIGSLRESPVNPGVVGGSGRGDRRAGLLRGADMPDGGRHAGALGGRSRRCPAALVFGAPGAVAAGRGTGRISLDPALLVRVDRIDRT